MPIPDYQTIMLPLLQCLQDGQPLVARETVQKVSDLFALTTDERGALLDSGGQPIINNRVAWARTYLKKAGLVAAPRRGIVTITERGLAVLAEKPEKIDNHYLSQFEEFIAFKNTSKKGQSSRNDNENIGTSTSSQIDADPVEEATPTESMQQAHAQLNEELADELLDTIKNATPLFFEQLVIKLMLAMGYGGWSHESGRATQVGADGGIDGIINEDPLGLETIYLQAKRYKTDNTIGRPDIQAFSGALDMQRARKGVFITTSKFSAEALDYVQRIEKSIVLIDGKQLASHMINYGLGVSTKQTFEIKQIDTDYFSEE